MKRILIAAAAVYAAVIGWHVAELRRLQWQRDRIEAIR